MFGIGTVKTTLSQRTEINKWVYFVVIKTVFKDKRLFVYNRSQDFFPSVHEKDYYRVSL